MNATTWESVCESVPSDMPLRDVEDELARIPTLSEDERAAIWLYAWAKNPERSDRQKLRMLLRRAGGR